MPNLKLKDIYILHYWPADVQGVPYTLAKFQISNLLLYPSLWLLVPGLSIHFFHCFLYNLLLRSALVSNIFGDMATRFCMLQEPLCAIRVQYNDAVCIEGKLVYCPLFLY